MSRCSTNKDKMTLPIRYDLVDWRLRKKAREEYVRVQGGCCSHCGVPLSGQPRDDIKGLSINWKLFPPNFLQHPVHLHHCHKTGWTIGAVHAYCNAVLWQYHGE